MNIGRSIAWFIVASLAGVASQVAWGQEPAPKSSADDVIAVAKGNTEFALDLFAHLPKDANLCFSPYSISAVLAMTSAGARGETEKQMAEFLRFSLPESKSHSAFAALQQRLTSSDTKGGYQLRIANRLWGQQGYHFLPDFLQLTRVQYGADLAQVNFSQADAARQTINSWTEEQTDSKIKNLIPPNLLDANTRLVLTNAIYLKGDWTYKFNKEKTTDAPFHISPTQQVKVPMMWQLGSFRYAADDGLQILHLPYVPSGSLSMLVLLPDQKEGLAELQKRLTNDNLRTWSKGLKAKIVNVYLPKFRVTSEFRLRDVLESMGMTLAFDPDRADFSGISTQEPLFISAVIHKAFVDVNEEGTEAAATTTIDSFGMGRAVRRDVFRADHPFVFVIRDDRTESILFLGQVLNPQASN